MSSIKSLIINLIIQKNIFCWNNDSLGRCGGTGVHGSTAGDVVLVVGTLHGSFCGCIKQKYYYCYSIIL